MSESLPLVGRTALVTGVGRREGIAFAVALRLARMGASLMIQHYRPHDEVQPWGADDLAAVMDELRDTMTAGAVLGEISADLQDPHSPQRVIRQAREHVGHLDILACVHARSGGDGTLSEVTEAVLDGHWAVNARSALILTQQFAAQHDGRAGGRTIWMTSGQQLGPLRGEVAYGASKAVLAGMTATVADELAEQGILLNTVNPGPVNTGFLSPGMGMDEDTLNDLRERFPAGRFAEPDDPARLIAWLVSDDGQWMVGQVFNSEGGFRRA